MSEQATGCIASAPYISVVVPAHNEVAGLQKALACIEAVVAGCTEDYELIVIDDGSVDGTFSVIEGLAAENERVLGLQLSRNFGKEAALLAGLRQSAGDLVVTMDADLQHPPELIPQLVEHWKSGFKVVNAVKQDRPNDAFLVRMRARVFNTILSSLGGIDVHNASDYKLLDRSVVNVLAHELPERVRFYRGLSLWLGFPQTDVPFSVAEREDGESKWGMLALIQLALTAILSFTNAPLRIVTSLGFLTMLLGFFVGGDALWSWFHGTTVSGFTTIITTMLILSSFIMISLGIIGEYIAKIYDEIKQRPTYLVSSVCSRKEKVQAVSSSARGQLRR